MEEKTWATSQIHCAACSIAKDIRKGGGGQPRSFDGRLQRALVLQILL